MMTRLTVTAAALATLGSMPLLGGAPTTNPHTSVSNITVRVPVRPSNAPETERPYEVGDDDQTVIIGPDDERKLVENPNAFPFRAVVSIVADGSACSGWLYGADVVATAGHCIHKDGRWARTVKVRTANWPYKRCEARALFTSAGWTLDDERYDYASIKLNCNMGRTMGWLGYGWGHDLREGISTRLIGFGADRRGAAQLHIGPGTIDAVVDGQLFYSNDTGQQTSGAPVIAAGVCAQCVVAIHTKPAHDAPKPHRTSNHGTLISREVFQNLRAWKELR